MAATQQDIANKAKVSRSLVGHVLSGHPGIWVSEATKRRIIHTAKELNYHPNASARMLRTGKSRAVGMFSVSTRDPQYASILGGLSVGVCAEALSAAGYELRVKVFPDTASLIAGLSEAARGGLCDAFLVCGPDAERQGMLLEELGIRFATYGRFETTHPNWLQADYDHEGMMVAAVNSLADRGRSNPVMICYTGTEDYNIRLISGFKAACADRLRLDVGDDMILRQPANEFAQQVICDHFERWMALPMGQRPDSLVMGVETTAVRIIEQQIWRHGMRIGFGSGQMATSGASYPPMGWLIGDYLAFDSLDGNAIARILSEKLMLPLLENKEIKQTLIRLLPNLHERSGMESEAQRDLAGIAA